MRFIVEGQPARHAMNHVSVVDDGLSWQPPRRPWWLGNAHAQTVWARAVRSRRLVRFERETLTTPDDDDLVLDHTAGPMNAPRVLLLHGLEGSAYSLHTQGLAALFVAAGWRCTVLNFRSCARDPRDRRTRLRNRRPRLYHAGDTNDLDLVLRVLTEREPSTPLGAVGFSLGGNVLLKWLGENPRQMQIRAAATISVPYDLGAAAHHLDRPTGRFYFRHFGRRLKTKALDLLARFPRETSHLDADRVQAAAAFSEFDACLTAPLHGFANARDYHERASSMPHLGAIDVPTLCLSSLDDPFIPDASVESARHGASRAVTFRITPWGGHTGFVAGPWPWKPDYWAERATVNWLVAHACAEGHR